MFFVDYYSILETNINASPNEIKQAYKTQALKWHPDKNQGKDTTKRMQNINEAYLILKDLEARKKYNAQYKRYQGFVDNENSERTSKKEYSKSTSEFNTSEDEKTFTFNDDLLNKWIVNARKQAIQLAKQTLDDYKNISITAVTGTAIGCGFSLISYLAAGLFFTILLGLVKACNL